MRLHYRCPSSDVIIRFDTTGKKMIMQTRFLHCKYKRHRNFKRCWPVQKAPLEILLSLPKKVAVSVLLPSKNRSACMHTNSLFLNASLMSINMGKIIFYDDHIYASLACNTADIFFYFFVFAIKHYNVNLGIQPFQQIPGNFPVTNMAAQNNPPFCGSAIFRRFSSPSK